MARGVLLVEPDIDALGTLASKLRARGLNVWLADSLDGALERVRSSRPDAILIASRLLDDGEAAQRFLADRDAGEVPRFLLAGIDDALPPESRRLPRDDVDAMAKALHSLPSAPRVAAERGDFRGDLKQVSIVDLLQLLSMNRRTGSLTITTPAGAGEVRIADGEIVDAVYRRLEGEKALYRMLGEDDGGFAFASGGNGALRRIQVGTNALLMDGLRRQDEVRLRREGLGAGDDALLMVALPPPDAPAMERCVAECLVAPRTVEELLDDVPEGDLEILEALEKLMARGEVRRIPKGAVRHELADPEHMAVLGAVCKRLQKSGFESPARLVLAASTKRLSTVAHSVRRIADALAPAESVPTAPVPHLLATLRIGEGAELDVVGLPALDAYSPIWALALPGAAVVIRLDAPDSGALEEAATIAEVPLMDAAALMGAVDEADPAQMAALIRMALDALAGG